MHKSFQYALESTSTNEFPNENKSNRLPLQLPESSTPSRGHRLPFDRSCQARSPPIGFLPWTKWSPAREVRGRPVPLRPSSLASSCFELLRAAATGSFASTQIYNCTGKKQIQSYFPIRNIPQLPIFLSFTDIILLSPQRHNSFHLAMTTSSPRDETRPSGRLTTLPESNISNAH